MLTKKQERKHRRIKEEKQKHKNNKWNNVENQRRIFGNRKLFFACLAFILKASHPTPENKFFCSLCLAATKPNPLPEIQEHPTATPPPPKKKDKNQKRRVRSLHHLNLPKPKPAPFPPQKKQDRKNTKIEKN